MNVIDYGFVKNSYNFDVSLSLSFNEKICFHVQQIFIRNEKLEKKL